MAKTNRLRDLRGVGVKLEQQLAALGIHSINDLLLHLPFRYEDRTNLIAIGSLRPGLRVLVNGKIEYSGVVYGRRRSLIVILNDGTGLLYLRFFHFRQQQQLAYKAGGHLRCFGEVRAGYKGLEMVHPTCERITANQLNRSHEAKLTPIYPSAAGLQQNRWLKLTEQALQLLADDQLSMSETLPADIRRQYQLLPIKEALLTLHRPDKLTDVDTLLSREHPAQLRFILEELAAHQLAMQATNQKRQQQQSPKLSKLDLWHKLETNLPFQLTSAQSRVIAEITGDLANQQPMLRLLQGDVGSGKTVVAAAAAAVAIAAGYQVAVMAPTELLAEQHLQTLSEWFRPFDIKPVWLVSKLGNKAKQAAIDAIATGVPMVIGTHALMQDHVEFHSLGLVIVDEQHRFGVGQRLALRDKGSRGNQRPHQLIMTATPIPRTLAMTAYAGLDVSIIDELPPGRKPVTTVAISNTRRDQVVQRLSNACSDGSQAYWVCTLIEESDQLQAQAAEQTLELLQKQLPDLNIAMVHGRMKSNEKDAVMQRFRNGLIHLLVATTVIEVGVDVPNASLMIIDNAERLGLAQLHQLRGRIGRGSTESSCVLMYQPPLGTMAKSRLETLRSTNDGFIIAEQDLQLRGAGEVLGTRQTGMQQLKIADLSQDNEHLSMSIELAKQLTRHHPKAAQRLIARWIGHATNYAEA